MSDAEKIIEVAREFFRDNPLDAGERVVVSTCTQCGCHNERLSEHATRCHVCGGKGFVFEARTFTARLSLESPDAR